MKDNFSIVYEGWKPEKQKLREALCTLGNGYIATRGAAEESRSDDVNYPGTYLAGGFNRAKTELSGKMIENEDFVNFPNWLCLNFRAEGGAWLNLHSQKILAYRQRLDMKCGILMREFRVEDEDGRITAITSKRIVSMRDKHIAVIHWSLTPENWSGKIEFRSGLDGNVINDNVARYRELENRHLEPQGTEKIDDNAIFLFVSTRQSRIFMAQAARTSLYHNESEMSPVITTNQREGYIEQVLRVELEEGKTYTLEKVVGIYTSRDRAISEPGVEAKKSIKRAGRFEEISFRHEEALKTLWNRADIGIINGDSNQQLLRLHIFHLLQTVSTNIIGMDVGVPSRGLHGEGYRGHIFWDELYIFPFLNLRFPDLTRSLLMYRYYRIEEARFAAKEDGKKGAMYPWQSGSNGREETQVVHLNPQSGNWIPDNTHLQRHINSAIAYNIWNYYLTTEDQQFLSYFGAEMFLSIAQFWESMTSYNEEKDRYEIHGVVGPDEYHTSYPDSDQLGLNNNAYTNVMAAWVMQKALHIVEIIEKSRRRELMKELHIQETDLELWQDISTKMYVPFIEEDIIAQFEGYEKLDEFPWEEYRNKYENIHRLDRVLENEGDSPNRYKASKQADVLMLFYLFTKTEIQRIFKNLGIEYSEEMVSKSIAYYRERTSHGSTLSRVVFSWILLKYDQQQSWDNFETVLISDFEDIQGGTTPEGIHLGAMAGSLDLVQRAFLGLEVGEEALWIDPPMLDHLKKISLRVQYRRHWIAVSLDDKKLTITFETGWKNEVKIGVKGKIFEFKLGEVREFLLN
ncbi:glycoside hydrolase family 65 protein [Cyclobacterium jeungdonense]|uniref:Glycoside hydrolase family 65 protein n=1 Tax=Cyclobacterium jeungdonense TaxID=708087 RepID=A0ABT8C2U7_9BACT|nr:glycoside hydrolase family 65 protein [Cyclobacterium jeungdonense]MDN3686687.1 glycoside hydrolase family 65 protein [Cyclobacterium jeungdonense]